MAILLLTLYTFLQLQSKNKVHRDKMVEMFQKRIDKKEEETGLIA